MKLIKIILALSLSLCMNIPLCYGYEDSYSIHNTQKVPARMVKDIVNLTTDSLTQNLGPELKKTADALSQVTVTVANFTNHIQCIALGTAGSIVGGGLMILGLSRYLDPARKDENENDKKQHKQLMYIGGGIAAFSTALAYLLWK